MLSASKDVKVGKFTGDVDPQNFAEGVSKMLQARYAQSVKDQQRPMRFRAKVPTKADRQTVIGPGTGQDINIGPSDRLVPKNPANKRNINNLLTFGPQDEELGTLDLTGGKGPPGGPHICDPKHPLYDPSNPL
jgi:hypothetical protein|tara:strand:- start:1009 stop:1407 length:399 start_codon:yes stop_codon:yes gene_type:complete